MCKIAVFYFLISTFSSCWAPIDRAEAQDIFMQKIAEVSALVEKLQSSDDPINREKLLTAQKYCALLEQEQDLKFDISQDAGKKTLIDFLKTKTRLIEELWYKLGVDLVVQNIRSKREVTVKDRRAHVKNFVYLVGTEQGLLDGLQEVCLIEELPPRLSRDKRVQSFQVVVKIGCCDVWTNLYTVYVDPLPKTSTLSRIDTSDEDSFTV